MRTTSLLLFLLLVAVTPLPIRASLIAYESFDYTANNEIVQEIGGGIGFVGNWQTGSRNSSFSTWRVGSVDLNYPNLTTNGLSVFSLSSNGVSGARRSTNVDFVGDSGTTSYISFLIRRNGTAGGFGGFGGIYLDGTTSDELFIGKGGNGDTWGIGTLGGTGDRIESSVDATVGETSLIVVKLESLVGNDRFTMYVNPTDGTNEPSNGIVKTDLDLGTTREVHMYQTGQYSIDEIRIGTTYSDVLAFSNIPEPTSAFSFSFLVGVAILKRRKSAIA